MKEFDNEIVIFSPTLTIAFLHAEFGYMCEKTPMASTCRPRGGSSPHATG